MCVLIFSQPFVPTLNARLMLIDEEVCGLGRAAWTRSKVKDRIRSKDED